MAMRNMPSPGKYSGLRKNEIQDIKQFYMDSFIKYGATPPGVGWEDQSSQALRFEKIIHLIDWPQNKVSINDFGCGYGAMFRYLCSRQIQVDKYFGYDICDDMLTKATSTIKDARAVFNNSDQVLYRADFTFISGTFNLKLSHSDRSWSEYVRQTLVEIASKSVRGIAFNMLSSDVEDKQCIFYYADPCNYFNFCKRNISSNVSLLNDYPLGEWTMVIKL